MENLLPSPDDVVSRAAESAWDGLCRSQDMPPMDWVFENRDDYWVMVGRPAVAGLEGLDACVQWMERAVDPYLASDVELRDGYGFLKARVGGVQVELVVRVDEDHRREWEDLQFARQNYDEVRRGYESRELAWRERVRQRYMAGLARTR